MTEDWAAVANGLARIGPAVAYVGFSMGAIFGLLAAAALPDAARSSSSWAVSPWAGSTTRLFGRFSSTPPKVSAPNASS
jgi:pimeloyl-ACP methyl ester carboxylesterase